ncbi:ABC transporter ATP-binding protein [Roseomonas terrae]|jgi:peptide/nickel transport system ATP-binding protein|uniref:ABC transporter ATP-binding protein n=1 Tax=Neoroseomonas terrae TaxID=424799 RepID=A0ABS5ECR7_9PROT|nr:ABC transporter ATP-binding protein [Neoroseomonas terrae]MBR0648813.1 ABC transporter ATP-binding protein [Neoroseomonas terrae]
MTDDLALDIQDLHVSFPTRAGLVRAVDGVSLSLVRGKTTCVVGESGSGKSVTARAILQIIDPPGRITGGRILLRREGEPELDVATLGPRSRAIRELRGHDIAMIFQEPMSSLSPVHRIGDQIGEAVRLHLGVSRREARSRAAELLAQVEIPDPRNAIDRYTFEFSGGMRQRAMIAMALACNPSILIADEPTTALDVTTQAEILDLLRRLQDARGMTMMFITHDMGVVAEIAHDVVVMERGQVRERGPVHTLFADPRDAYTRMLLGNVTKLESPSAIRLARPSRPIGPPVLSLRDVEMRFGGRKGLFRRGGAEVRAVDGISLDVRAGETLGVVGESGSGKTTLGRCILRVLDPTGGAIDYRRRDGSVIDLVNAENDALRAARREIRMVFQDPFASLNPRMTVAQIVGEPLLVNGLARGAVLQGKVASLLERVGIDPNSAERYPHAFSGGQRQRIGIARALALSPRVIVADEPTSALDVSIRARTLDLLLELQDELDLALILISHDISVIRYMCDRVAVMHRGRVVETGETIQVCDDPQHAYTKALLSAVPRPDPTARRMHLRHRYTSA